MRKRFLQHWIYLPVEETLQKYIEFLNDKAESCVRNQLELVKDSVVNGINNFVMPVTLSLLTEHIQNSKVKDCRFLAILLRTMCSQTDMNVDQKERVCCLMASLDDDSTSNGQTLADNLSNSEYLYETCLFLKIIDAKSLNTAALWRRYLTTARTHHASAILDLQGQDHNLEQSCYLRHNARANRPSTYLSAEICREILHQAIMPHNFKMDLEENNLETIKNPRNQSKFPANKARDGQSRWKVLKETMQLFTLDLFASQIDLDQQSSIFDYDNSKKQDLYTFLFREIHERFYSNNLFSSSELNQIDIFVFRSLHFATHTTKIADFNLLLSEFLKRATK
ncbi:MAG: hypothetical protein MHMPM18_002987 [Marteilia pararefringens]